MATGEAVSGFALASVLAGTIFLYSGIKGISVLKALQSVVQGKNPKDLAQSQPISPLTVGETDTGAATPSATSVPVTATGSTIANDAVKYAGHCYLYGGAPGPNGTSCWDCSSFCNWVLGHDLGFTLPGSSSPGYNGKSHGPNTVSYLGWSGAETVGHSSSVAQAGDLCVWQTHMGIALGGGKMISALNESLGTRITPIDGQVTGEVLFVRRIIIGNPHG